METRSKSKSIADLTASGAERTPFIRIQRSPCGVRPALPTATASVSGLPQPSTAEPVTHPERTFSSEAQPSPTQRSCDHVTPRQGNTETLVHEPISVHSGHRSSHRSHSSRSSATVRAQKVAAEADVLRRRLQRERELARLEAEVEQAELNAKLAALDARDKSSCSYRSKRTATWVSEQNANATNLTHGYVPDQVAAVNLDNVQVHFPQQATHVNAAPPTQFVAVANTDRPTHVGQNVGTPQDTKHLDPLTQLANAISALSDRPKKPDLGIFTGDVSQWMTFKTNYERSKSVFSPAENLVRLSNAIRGPAHESVASLLWTSRDPQDVMEALEQTYARPELLVAREVAELRGNTKISSPKDLNALANKLRNFVATLKMLRQSDYLYSPELFRCVLLKLSEHTRARFTDYASATQASDDCNIAKLELLSRFLLSEADKQLKYNFIFDDNSKFQISSLSAAKPLVKKETVHNIASAGKPADCTYCEQGNHTIKTCKKFLSLAVEDRWRWVRKSKVCYRCLKGTPHTWNNCKIKPCGVDGCIRRHNSLLHGTATATDSKNANNRSLPDFSTHAQCNHTQVPSASPPIPTDVDETETHIKVANTSDILFNTAGPSQPAPRPRGLLKTLPVVIEGPDGEFETVALLDEGSTATLIDGDVAERVGIKPSRKERLHIEGVAGMAKVVDVGYVNFYVRGRNLTDRYFIEHARAVKPLGLRVNNPVSINYTEYAHLTDLANELSYTNDKPTILIGAPDWHLLLSREVRCGSKNEPVASRTLLGWVVHGALSVSSKPVDFINHVNEDLDALIKLQYEIDSLGIMKNIPRRSDDDQRAIDIVESSARQLNDGHYEVALPWKKNLPKIIPDSYPQALSRFKALQRQMSKDAAFTAAYQQFMDNIISKGYAEECDPATYYKRLPPNESHVNADGGIRWYLPTFGVFHPQKKKIRVVHDAAAVTKNVCLNSLLLQGPDLLCSLLDILFRFREGAVALNADIKEMFPQVKITVKDRDAQRFLWHNKDGVIMEYRMASMIFGAACSPFIALYIKDKNAKNLESTYPTACRAILEDHYMDDYLGSLANATDAARLAADIVTVHKTCGFEMRAWTTNDPNALSLVPKELWSDASSDVYLPPNNDVGVLGVKWNPRQDSLSFRTQCCVPPDALTKRNVLSSVMKIYDPLGLLMPIIIWGRIIIQKLWREGIDWDIPVPDKFVIECNDWFVQLEEAAAIRIPRWYMSTSDPVDIQLHMISDGGEQAYACVAYWRFTYADGSVSTTLIGSKARVSPLKPLSIPRLELQAALVASRLAQTIIHAHRISPSKVTFWTDSTTVLKWIRSDARAYKAFVAHRLGEILETTSPSNWRWIPAALNVADDATKPKKLNLTAAHRWFSGPPFLLDPPCTWPIEQACDVEETSPDAELKSELVGLLLDVTPYDPPVPSPTRFSSWLRLLRATARVLQAARLFRLKLSRQIQQNSKLYLDSATPPSRLSVFDVVQAEKMLFQRVQIDSFPEEIKSAEAAQPVAKNSRLAKLALVLDDDRLLRLDSRITSTPGIDVTMKSPIILDGRHHPVRLLILHEHAKASHHFNELVLNELRQKYHILRARDTIRSVANACPRCRRYRGDPVVPKTGDLPAERLDHHKRPFTHVGLDYFGPISVTIHRRHEKRYVALYTCLVSRAIHLEVVTALTSDAAIMSLRRFIARRGSPTTIYSDNGTNFVGASRELRSLHNESVEEFATNHKITWRFIPALSPFMGGAWERLVRTTKTALRSCLTEKSLKEDVLTTFLHEAEAIINSRPLTYVPASSDSPEAITPFHFILGTSSVAPWTCTLTDADLVRRCDWRRVLRLADHFWTRWLREYLPTLRPRGSSNNATTLGEGDVVLVADPSLPRGLWPLGRVAKTYPGSDGAVRVVDVRTRGGTLRRPARKLILLEAEFRPVTTG